MPAVATDPLPHDPSIQLRALYMDLLRNQAHFDEFKHLLALYHPSSIGSDGSEAATAREIRRRLNDRISSWLGMEIEPLTPGEVLQWRAIVVEARWYADRPSDLGTG